MKVSENNSHAIPSSHFSARDEGKRHNIGFARAKLSRIPSFAILSLIFLVTCLLFIASSRDHAEAQQLVTSTPTASMVATLPGPYITVTYIEPINVRTGPSSFDYPIIGSIQVGGIAPAIGRSPAGEWIQILFQDGPRGKGWVYAANVSLSPGALLPIVEPPPTPTPLMTPTLNPTFVAAFQTLPTATHLPTFTPPPSLVIPTFTNPDNSSDGRAISTWVIVIIGFFGILGIVFSSIRRR
jgi:hypothetical protein